MKRDRNAKIMLSEKQIIKLQKQATDKATKLAMLLMFGVMADCLNMNDDEICEVANTAARYARYLDDHVLRLNEIAEVVEEKTGLKMERFL